MGAGAAGPALSGAVRHAGPLRLLHLPVARWRIAELHRRIGGHELGWVLHHAIGDACAAPPPAPFMVAAESDALVHVLAFSRTPLAQLRAVGAAVCAAKGWSERHGGVLWDQAQELALPATDPGRCYRFRVRAAVIKRVKRGGRHVEMPMPYGERPAWLSAQMSGCSVIGGIEVVPGLLATTRRAQWASGGKSGPPVRIDVPVIDASGALTVTDTTLFKSTLARGIGRHRSYGLGMLVLDAA